MAISRRLALALVVALSACTPPSGRGLNKDALDSAIGRAIGDPATCVLLADRASLKVVYRYGDGIECARSLPRCDGAGVITVQGALAFATQPGGRFTSCPSNADGSRTVGWAAARVPNTKRDLVYSAVMEGDRALPGQEISARLADAFANAGV
jgi:hypothetical protein